VNYSEAFSANGKPPGGIADFDSTAPAPEFSPLPPGIYSARVAIGEYCSTKAGAEAYRLKFEVTEGEQAGRTVQRIWTFGAKALAYTRRDLQPFGLTSQRLLLMPYPAGKEVSCRLVVALRRGDDGSEFNDIRRIDVVRIEETPASRFIVDDVDEGGQK
jgi:hypothetical protein